MRSLAYILIASLALSGVALADDSNDQYGATPDCNAGQSDAVSEGTASAPFRACEGEHWEGGDAASGNTGDCNAATTTTVAFENCGNGHFDQGSDEPGQLGVRVSQGTGAYVSAQIGGVGQAAVYTDGSGLVAVFLQDYSDTLGVTCLAFAAQDCNALAEAVHAAGITRGAAVGEEDPDCTVDSYAAGACTRDNTAVTIDVTP